LAQLGFALRKATPKSLPGASITLITVTEEDEAMVSGKELMLGLFAQNVRRNAKSLLNPGMTVRYTARIAFQSAKKATHLTQTGTTGPKKEIFPGNAVPIKDGLKKGKSLLKRGSHFSPLHNTTLFLTNPAFLLK
jgi:hypothetical protein